MSEHRKPRHFVDVHVGRRLRERRWLLGLSLDELGQRVDINPQQIQKYETAENRTSASRLWELSSALDVPVSYFFEGLRGQAPHPGQARGDLLNDREAAELLRAYYALPETHRKRLFDLARALGNAA